MVSLAPKYHTHCDHNISKLNLVSTVCLFAIIYQNQYTDKLV